MSWLELPDGTRMEPFGSGGGAAVASSLSVTLGAEVPLLGQIPQDPALLECSDTGTPYVLHSPSAPAAVALRSVADRLAVRARGLAGMSLSINPGVSAHPYT
jgi:ATP-binding protein involved in chromosome partitioning